MFSYRGFEIYPLVYPHTTSLPGAARNYDDGFAAAVRICMHGPTLTYSDTFKLSETPPFTSAGEARRASLAYAQSVIDKNGGKNWMSS
jgi:hypothetical protein